jgi:signal transduction histidine kinase
VTIAAAFLAVALAAALIVAAVQTRRLRDARASIDDARVRADRADRAREAFFDLATHELRSPLAAILGYQELLRDGAYGDLPDAAAEPVVRIGRSARHLLNLIDGVVELSRLRGGALRPDLEPVNLAVVLSGIAEAFQTHAADRGMEARVDIPASLPTITSDFDRLTRALDLLITSAMKHPEGDTLALEARSTSDGLEIRIHPTNLEVQDGSDDLAIRLGIRLAVAGGIAELLGGALELESDDDGRTVRGLRFSIRDLGEGAGGRM